jgi:hypothetical protein
MPGKYCFHRAEYRSTLPSELPSAGSRPFGLKASIRPGHHTVARYPQLTAQARSHCA